MVESLSKYEMENEGIEVTPDDELDLSGASLRDAQDPAEDFFLGNDKITTGAAGKNAYRAFLED